MTTGSALHRAINVEIDRASWRAQPVQFQHPFPRALQQQSGPAPIHLLAMLLRLGELTTPVLNVQSGVARLWPLLRYLHAIAETPGFRFRSAWADTDRHQKAIASDDLGVGLGMSVLYGAFNYTACIDGRAFLHRLSQLGLLASPGGKPPKVGTMKMADFAALDGSGKYHLIECKGTQDTKSALLTAMSNGVSQKQSLVCGSTGAERRLIGQRLVVGAHLVLENSTKSTTVRITDPAPLEEDPTSLAPRVPTNAFIEPAIRLELARSLGTAGAVRTAAAVAESDRPAEAAALTGAAPRNRAQRAFSLDEPELERFDEYGQTWIGERVVMPLLEPLQYGDAIYRFARMIKGVSIDVLGELREGTAPTPFFQEQYPAITSRLRPAKVITGDADASILRPGISLSSVELLKTRAG